MAELTLQQAREDARQEPFHEPQTSIVIQNIIVSTELTQTLNLELIAFSFPKEADYRPEQFPAVFFRAKVIRKLVSIFSTGKLVSVGAKTELEAQTAIQLVVSELKDAGLTNDGQCKPRVQNVVATIEFHRPIYLEKAHLILDRTIYEPELFPALIHRSLNPALCYLLFAQGKAICLGAKSIEDIRSSTQRLESKLEASGAFVPS